MYRSSSLPARTILTLALLTLGACSSDAPTAPRLSPTLSRNAEIAARAARVAICPTDESYRAEGVLGPRGGSLRVAGHRLTIPPGVLSEATRFTLNAPAGREVKLELRAGNEKHHRFSAPVVVTISYDRCTRQRPAEYALSAWHVDDTGTRLIERMGGEDDRRRRAVTFRTMHFSTYLVAY